MAQQAELVEFFEMMATRARAGEFRFVAIATISTLDTIAPTLAGMATDEEATMAVDLLHNMAAGGIYVDTPSALN